MLLREIFNAFNLEQIQKPTVTDIEMAAAIDTAINAFYIKHPRPKGIHLHTPSEPFSQPTNVSVSFGRHRIGREEINPSHHIAHHTKAFYYYDIRDTLDPKLRKGIEIGPTGIRYYTVLINGTPSEFSYSPNFTQNEITYLTRSFQSMPKKPGDLRIPLSISSTTQS